MPVARGVTLSFQPLAKIICLPVYYRLTFNLALYYIVEKIRRHYWRLKLSPTEFAWQQENSHDNVWSCTVGNLKNSVYLTTLISIDEEPRVLAKWILRPTWWDWKVFDCNWNFLNWIVYSSFLEAVLPLFVGCLL